MAPVRGHCEGVSCLCDCRVRSIKKGLALFIDGFRMIALLPHRYLLWESEIRWLSVEQEVTSACIGNVTFHFSLKTIYF